MTTKQADKYFILFVIEQGSRHKALLELGSSYIESDSIYWVVASC